MNAELVYQIVMALPREEQKLLLNKLKKDFKISSKVNIPKKVKVLNKEDAINYLLINVFSNKKQKKTTL